MWRLLVIIAFAGAPAYADITHKLQSSVQLTVDAAATNATRLGSSFAISGNGVDTTDGTTANTISAGTITSGVYAPGTISATQDTPGSSFSLVSHIQQVTPYLPQLRQSGTPNFSSVISTTAGTAGNLAGTITSAGAVTVTAGGAGTTATGQHVSEITVR